MEIKFKTLVEIYGALHAIGSYEKVISEGGNTRSVKCGASLSMDTRDLVRRWVNAIKNIIESYNAVRSDRVQELANGEDEIPMDDKVARKTFFAEDKAARERVYDIDLPTFGKDELKLAQNTHITGDTLAALGPAYSENNPKEPAEEVAV